MGAWKNNIKNYMAKNLVSVIQFGQHSIPMSQLFLLRKHVFATVNLKPVIPGIIFFLIM
jgi:hypothetical protein